MNKLSNDIYAYYVSHFDELTFDKQLHFASRLYLWQNDDFGAEKLKALRNQVTANENSAAALKDVYDRAIETIHHGSKNAAELRAPYFRKYPNLRLVAMLLFRVTFLKTIYGIDARNELFKLVPKTDIDSLMSALLDDTEALAILSTHAVNTLYLYSRIILEDDKLFNPSVFLDIGSSQYDLNDPIHLQLYIYLYTHCIIGESHFYARALPSTHQAVYAQMADELEAVISDRFSEINLDNKFEFLVCCLLVGKQSALTARIESEAAQSLADEGTFLVDRHNSNPQTANNTLDLSEHRNVLYIMSQQTPTFLAG